ncbi:hypothetical protein QJS66_02555 [Kocuria rhizophila]|nr:hypothetical protein QJS66_02555 [Kocuria rhizophila]
MGLGRIRRPACDRSPTRLLSCCSRCRGDGSCSCRRYLVVVSRLCRCLRSSRAPALAFDAQTSIRRVRVNGLPSAPAAP